MRFSAWMGVALLAVCGATGCRSAHIKEAYLSRDDKGVRRTNFFCANWNHYFVFVDLLSFKDDTLMTPYLIDGSGNGVALAWEDDEVAEFGNFAPGKGENILTWEVKGPLLNPDDPNSDERGPLNIGNFTWQFYLDDHSKPDEQLPFAVDNCP